MRNQPPLWIRLLGYLLVAVAAFLMPYLAGAFVSLEWDVREWSFGGRISLLATFYGLIALWILSKVRLRGE